MVEDKRFYVDVRDDWWECGDGCCSGVRSDVYVNDVEVFSMESAPFDFEESVYRFIGMLNELEEGQEIEIVYSYVLDDTDDGSGFGDDLDDAVFVGGILLSVAYYGTDPFGAIARELGVDHRVVMCEYDDELFDRTGEVLIREDESYE